MMTQGMVYFKEEWHQEDYAKIMVKLGKTESFDPYYDSCAYLIAATGKADELLSYFNREGIIVGKILDVIGVYSGTEQAMIEFAIHLFNDALSKIPFHDVVRSLDSENYKAVFQAIELRYGPYIKD